MKIGNLAATCYMLLVLGLVSDAALANKFVTISGGVSGTTIKKMELLRAASLMLGSIITLIGLFSLIPKLHGHSDINASKITLQMSFILIAVGLVLVGLFLL